MFRFPKLLISIFAICFTIVIGYKYISETSSVMTVSFLDVGQGDAVLITAPNGNRLLYDSGTPDDKAVFKLNKEIPKLFSGIDVFIASHPDADHIGGFEAVLRRYKPLYYVDNNRMNLSSLFANLENSLTSKQVERYTATDGEKINLGRGVIVNIVSPLNDNNSVDVNDQSVSILVSYGESKILLTGDLEEKEENRIVEKYGENLSATILKAGHHGSKTSTGKNLLNSVKPKYVVVSVGKNNKYGHPNVATLNRIKESGAEVLQTKDLGTITFNCDYNNCVLYK